MERRNPPLTKEYEQVIWQVAQDMYEQQKNYNDYSFDDITDQFEELKKLYETGGISKDFIDFVNSTTPTINSEND